MANDKIRKQLRDREMVAATGDREAIRQGLKRRGMVPALGDRGAIREQLLRGGFVPDVEGMLASPPLGELDAATVARGAPAAPVPLGEALAQSAPQPQPQAPAGRPNTARMGETYSRLLQKGALNPDGTPGRVDPRTLSPEERLMFVRIAGGGG